MRRVFAAVVVAAFSVFGQVYPYGWVAFPAWGSDTQRVADVPLYYGIEKEREQVIKEIRFNNDIRNFVVYVEWKTIKARGK